MNLNSLLVAFLFTLTIGYSQGKDANDESKPKLTLKLTETEHKELVDDLKDYIANYEGGDPPKEVLRAYVINWYLALRQRELQRYSELAARVLRPGKGLWTYGRRRRAAQIPDVNGLRPNLGWGKRGPELNEQRTVDFPLQF